VLALLDRHARVVASSRVISTSDGTHVLGTWKVIEAYFSETLNAYAKMSAFRQKNSLSAA